MNRKSFLRIADSVALVASCSAIGVIALKMGIVLCEAALLVLGAAFLAGDLWHPARGSREARRAASVPDARSWPRPSSLRIALRPGGD